MRNAMRNAMLVMAFLALSLSACSDGDSVDFPDGSTGDGGEGGGAVGGGGSDDGGDGDRAAVRQLINRYRSETGLPALAEEDYLAEAATWHAGYQSVAAELTHVENNQANPFFRGSDLSQRINRAATGDPATWPDGVTIVYEDVATNGDTAAVELWWNSVYHRQPLMRFDVQALGYGDREHAARLPPGDRLPSNGHLYGTLNFAGDVTVTRSLSFWPADGLDDVPTAFNTDYEIPDPLDGDQGAGDNNIAPSIGRSGPPLHVIYPTNFASFTEMTVTLTRNDFATRVAVYVLVPSQAAPLNEGLADPIFYSDSYLDPGEVFILPRSPLASGVEYEISVTASVASGPLPGLSWRFRTR